MSAARSRKRWTGSDGVVGRGPCARAARYACAAARAASSGPSRPSAARTRASTASRERWLSSIDTSLRTVLANECVEATDALLDRLRRRRVRETNVLPVARNAASEVNVGEHRDARLVQQPLAKRLGVGRLHAPARLGDVRPRVERAAGNL